MSDSQPMEEERKAMSETNKRVFILQCLCPSRHCILADAVILPAEPTDGEKMTAHLAFAEEINLFLLGPFNPWCDLCGAPKADWKIELGRTRFKDLDEAMPFLKANEEAQRLSAITIKNLQKKAGSN